MIDSGIREPRLYYLDWLRIFTIGVVFLYHCVRPFGHQAWHIANATSNLPASLYVEFFRIWMMPLFFVLSGAAIAFSLRRRSMLKFVGERFMRLLVPLVGIGWFVIGPIQIYFERLTYGQFDGTLVAFFPHYFDGLSQFGGNFAWHGMNLWFLLYLFILSLLWLPWFIPFGKTRRSMLGRLAPALGSVWMLLLLAAPLAAVDHLVSALDMAFLRGTGGWSFFSYGFLLPVGYMLFSSKKTLEAVHRLTWFSLAVAAALSALYVIVAQGLRAEIVYGSWQYYGLTLARSTAALMWIYALLGLGHRYLNASSTFVKHGNEGGLPFYILHQTLIVVLGYFILRWQLPTAVKVVLIVVSAGVGTLLPYLLLIRRFNPLRFLFGMRLKS